MRATPFAGLLGFFLFLTGCQTPGPHAATTGPSVQHILVCWLNNPRDPAQRSQLIHAIAPLQQTADILSITTASATPNDQPMTDSSFDVVFVFTFADAAALQAYEQNPANQESLQFAVKPLTRKVVVYDATVLDLPSATIPSLVGPNIPSPSSLP